MMAKSLSITLAIFCKTVIASIHSERRNFDHFKKWLKLSLGVVDIFSITPRSRGLSAVF